MLGAVAIGYFFAAAAVMAIACSGPDVRAKFASAYLMMSWGYTNFISTHAPPDAALAEFTPWDAVSVAIFYIAMLAWPTRWIRLLLAGLTVQVVFQIRHSLLDPGERSIIASHAVNEAGYIVQLIACCIPTGVMIARRLRPGRARRARGIKPPYDGWAPPEELRP